MSEQSPTYQEHDRASDAVREQQRIVGEIVLLLPKVASRPGSAKLLQGILSQCQMFAAYKANRRYQR